MVLFLRLKSKSDWDFRYAWEIKSLLRNFFMDIVTEFHQNSQFRPNRQHQQQWQLLEFDRFGLVILVVLPSVPISFSRSFRQSFIWLVYHRLKSGNHRSFRANDHMMTSHHLIFRRRSLMSIYQHHKLAISFYDGWIVSTIQLIEPIVIKWLYCTSIRNLLSYIHSLRLEFVSELITIHIRQLETILFL